MTDLEPIYQFEIGEYAEKVEITGNPRAPDTRRAHMAIREEELLDMIDEMLSEVERTQDLEVVDHDG